MAFPNLDDTIAALADPARRQVVDLLRTRPRRAGELAAELDISPARMSQHLRVLRKSGFIEGEGVEEDARVRVIRLRPEPFTQLQQWLEQVQSFWTAELASFKAHAERSKAKRRT